MTPAPAANMMSKPSALLMMLGLVGAAVAADYDVMQRRGSLSQRRMLPVHEVAYMWHEETIEAWGREEGMLKLPGGVLVRRVKKGPQNASVGMPGPHSTMRAHYHGVYDNGEVWDSSVERGEAMVATPYQLLPAWKDALMMMCEGDEVEVGLPYFHNFDELEVRHLKVPAFAAMKTTLSLLQLNPGQAPHLPCHPYAFEEAAGVLTDEQAVELAALRAQWAADGVIDKARVAAAQAEQRLQDQAMQSAQAQVNEVKEASSAAAEQHDEEEDEEEEYGEEVGEEE
eukprot:TRINITY_DN448_c1_g1_i1.p1 TRINITY_DN448_c1_g1~~TRINITY_DN448_c1_g1_i1.p1  ORF type:complete len:284 (+),score=99.85 TRINITY_DN448_c1_g1_i1:49-900(+)